MSVIAYDGKTVAADSQYESNGTRLTMVKLRQYDESGIIMGSIGDSIIGAELEDWVYNLSEAWPKDMPAHLRSKDGVSASRVFVFRRGRAWMYGGGTVPLEVTAPFAMGSGQDAAMAAMRCGKTAAEAVEIACQVDVACGLPVVSFDVPEPPKEGDI